MFRPTSGGKLWRQLPFVLFHGSYIVNRPIGKIPRPHVGFRCAPYGAHLNTTWSPGIFFTGVTRLFYKRVKIPITSLFRAITRLFQFINRLFQRKIDELRTYNRRVIS